MGMHVSDSLAKSYYRALKFKDKDNDLKIERGKDEGYEKNASMDLNNDGFIDRDEAAVRIAKDFKKLSRENKKVIMDAIVASWQSTNIFERNGAMLTMGYLINQEGDKKDPTIISTLNFIIKHGPGSIKAAAEKLLDICKSGGTAPQPGFAPYKE